MPKEVLQFTRKLFGNIEIRESYGATEIGGIYSNKTVPIHHKGCSTFF